MTDTELKPCPFCGGEAEKIFIGNEHTKKRSLEIKCTKCRVKRVNSAIHHSHEWLDEVSTKAWNDRVECSHMVELKAENERLKSEAKKAFWWSAEYTKTVHNNKIQAAWEDFESIRKWQVSKGD